jgi:DNA replication and repair protein RecF
MLCDFNYLNLMRNFRKILLNRNNLLLNFGSLALEELRVWSNQLWEQSKIIGQIHRNFLSELQLQVNNLLDRHFNQNQLSCSIEFSYQARKIKENQTFEEFWEDFFPTSFNEECRFKRSLFGVHLDDFSIIFKNKNARSFASRGQQKLVVFLSKIAQSNLLLSKNLPVVILLDDFLTDFDENTTKIAFDILKEVSCQIFITMPLKSPIFSNFLNKFDVQQISL